MTTSGNCRGSATLMVGLCMIPMLGMLGLVFDLGWYYFVTEQAHAAAEAAAMAGVEYAMDNVAGGGTYTCGSKGTTCQSETNCAATVPSPITSNLQNACAYATANGFTNGGLSGKQTVTIEANTTNPTTVSGVSVSYWVTVRIHQSSPVSFLGVLGASFLPVGVRATAAVIPIAETDCMIALDSSSSKAITISGGANIVANNCAVAVASSSNDALDITGGSTLTASEVDLVGNTNCTSCVTPAPTPVNSLSNPYSSLAVPTFSTTCDAQHTNYTLNGGSATLSAGTYCGGITNKGGTLSFGSGTYILYGGGFTSSSSRASSSGTGVTFYNTCNPSPCNNTTNPQNNFSPFVLSGGGTASFSAPTSGAYSGIILFEDPTVTMGTKDTISGGSTSCFTGVFYVPQSYLTYSGGSSGGSCDTSLVADKITFSGGSNLGSSATGSSSSGPSAPTAMLIE